MQPNNKGRLLLAINVATIVTALITGALRPKAEGKLPSNLDSPVLAAELVNNAEEIRAVYVTNDGGKFSGSLRENTIADLFFIASYSMLFYLLGRLLPGTFGKMACLLAIMAAVADCVEDWGIWRILACDGCDGATLDNLAIQTRGPSLVKWGLLALVWLLLSRLFLSRHVRMGWELTRLLTGLGYAGAGLLTIWGLYEPDKIERALPLLSVAFILQVAILWRDQQFKGKHGLT